MDLTVCRKMKTVDRTLNLQISELQDTVSPSVTVWVQDHGSKIAIHISITPKGKKNEVYYVVGESMVSRKLVLVESLEGKHKLETRSFGQDDKCEQPAPKNNGPKKPTHEPKWKDMTKALRGAGLHIKEVSGVAEELQRKPGQRSIR